MSFFRSRAYQELFDWLDASGGFYYYRWGDAPVRDKCGTYASAEIMRFVWDRAEVMRTARAGRLVYQAATSSRLRYANRGGHWG